MPAITFRDGDAAWVVARWAFCGYLEHVRGRVEQDRELQYCVDEAMALDGLHLSRIPSHLADRLGPILLHVADDVVAGERPVRVEGRVLDARSQAQFRDAVDELRQLLLRSRGE